jgi:ribulose-5-phosphate 4-epimerase/fuculose-1-phosphate aldolase
VVGADLTNLDEKSVVICPLDKERDVPGASDRLPWYRGIYANQEAGAGGTLFCQPVYTMLAIGADLQLNDDWVAGVTAEIGGVARVQAVDLDRDEIASLAGEHHALLFRGSGALVWGETPADAIRRAAALEYASQLAVLAHQSSLQARGS